MTQKARNFIIEGETIIVPLNSSANGKVALLSLPYHYLENNCWHLTARGYVARTSKQGTIFLHHQILPKKDGFIVDHINGNTLDNRIENLRYATTKENAYNRANRSDNFITYKGVKYYKKIDRYVANIQKDGLREHLGTFKTALEAAKAYNKRAMELHGEYARLNHVAY